MSINNKLDGTILNYHPDKGFGFIQTHQNKELFFHIRDYRPNKEPVIGEKIVFDLGKDKQGRTCAVNIQELSFILNKEQQAKQRQQKRQAYEAYQERQEQKQSTLNLVCAIALIYMAIIAVLAVFFKAMTWLLLWHLVIGAISFFVYYLDKVAALNDDRRTPENTLHFVDVLGGVGLEPVLLTNF